MFSMIVDQKYIDDYLWYQKTLKQYQKHKKNNLQHHAGFKNQYMTYLSWQDDPDYHHCQLELQKGEKGKTLKLTVDTKVQQLAN